jgi:WW domain-containing oxidoreductase
LTEPDNLDSHFEVNVLSQLYLALILLPTLKAAAETTGRPSRVVLMSSEMHRFAPSSTEFASVEEINTDIGARHSSMHAQNWHKS